MQPCASTILHEGERGTAESAGEDFRSLQRRVVRARGFRRAARRSGIMHSERLLAMVRLRRCAAVVEACVVADASVRACAPATCEPVLADPQERTYPWRGKHPLLNRDRECGLY